MQAQVDTRDDRMEPPSTETTPYRQFVTRALTALAIRVGEHDEHDIRELADLFDHIDDFMLITVRILRVRGWSWGRVGWALQISRQAAQQKYGDRL
jgi:hypothetical protein